MLWWYPGFTSRWVCFARADEMPPKVGFVVVCMLRCDRGMRFRGELGRAVHKEMQRVAPYCSWLVMVLIQLGILYACLCRSLRPNNTVGLGCHVPETTVRLPVWEHVTPCAVTIGNDPFVL